MDAPSEKGILLMGDIRHLCLILLWIVVASQSLFVLRYGQSWRRWREDFVGRALFFKSSAVLYKAVIELVTWHVAPLIHLFPTWLLIAVVTSDIALALGCTWQYTALERQKREDRHTGTELGRDVEHIE